MRFVLKLVILLISLLGYMVYLHKKGIHPAFAPILTVASISIAMFFFGVLNIMPAGVVILLLGGYVCGFAALRRDSGLSRNAIVLFAIFTGAYFLFAIRLYSAVPTNYDNFSHWLLVVRDMLNHDYLPNFQTEFVRFQDYPTGMAGFLYYACKIIGPRDSCVLIAQGIVLISGLFPLFAFVTGSFALSGAAILLTAVYLLSVNVATTDLPVDTILSLMGIGTFALLVYYKDDAKKAAITSGILSAFLVLIKNSGIFFVGIHVLLVFLLLLIPAIRNRSRFPFKDWGIHLLAGVGMPLTAWYLWDRHVAYAFSNASTSKHSMSVESYQYVLSFKTPEDLQQTIANFIQRVCTPGAEVTVLLILLAVYLIFAFFHRRNRSQLAAIAGYTAWSILAYGFYLVGLLGMYLFSMPGGEALRLSSYDRYLTTITMYLTGIAVIYLLRQMSELPGKAVLFAGPVALCLLLFPIRENIPYTLWGSGSPTCSLEYRQTLQRLQVEYDIESYSSYYIIPATNEGGYFRYVARYDFEGPNAYSQFEPTLEQVQEAIGTYEYIIVLSQDEAVWDTLEQAGLPRGQVVYRTPEYR